MKLLNELFIVLETSDAESSFANSVQLNPAHIVYAGHFPGRPVTPGVIQLQIVHELLEQRFNKNLKLNSINQCKFLKILDPNETPRMVVQIEYKITDELLHVKARGGNETNIFFKLESVYQFL